MNCKCDKPNPMKVAGKCSDMYCGDYSDNGYVPSGLGIGGGDYIDFTFCLNCGQIHGEWPKQTPEFTADDEFGDNEETQECERCHEGVSDGIVMHKEDCPEMFG